MVKLHVFITYRFPGYVKMLPRLSLATCHGGALHCSIKNVGQLYHAMELEVHVDSIL